MATIIWMNLPAHGHVNPTLPVAQALIEQGHQVHYYNMENFRAKLESTGVTFHPYPAIPYFEQELAKEVINLPDVSVMLLRASQTLTPFMLEEIDRIQPDLLVFDSITIWGAICAHLTGLPSVSSITTIVSEGVDLKLSAREVFELVRASLPAVPKILLERQRLIRQYGKDSLKFPIFPCVGNLNIVYTSSYFQPQTSFIDDRFRFVGPAINPAIRHEDFPFEQFTCKPLVYISLGTIHHSLNFYKQCFRVFGDHDAQFILSVGHKTDIKALGVIPDNFSVFNSVPQLEVLQHVDAFITHGGMNSVNESLYYDVPMVVIPQHFEQQLNGKQVVRHYAGIMLGDVPHFGKVSDADLREALDKILTDPIYQQAAHKIGDSFREAGGYWRAVEEIETLIGQRHEKADSLVALNV